MCELEYLFWTYYCQAMVGCQKIEGIAQVIAIEGHYVHHVEVGGVRLNAAV